MIHPSLRSALRPTTIIEAPRLSNRLGLDLVLASETFQHTGSFKFRAAMNVALSISHPAVITASSGNFGQAIAYACSLTVKQCTVVMPRTSARVKIVAVREYGAQVDLIDVESVSRAARVAELASERPDAYVASAYDDDLVIAGNSTLAEELCAMEPVPEIIIAPVGGGGLTSGLVQGVQSTAEAGNPKSKSCPERSERIQNPKSPQVFGSEPLLANDAARSLREGRLLSNEFEPQTIADGTRTVSLGKRNWETLRTGLAGIVEVPEEAIREAVRLLFALANLKTEPTGALSLAACLADPGQFRDKRVCCVISGGNVDPELYATLIRGTSD